MTARKPFVRRRGDRSQFVRRSFQAAFLLLNFWIGAQFYVFVRHFETAGATLAVPRPPGVEGWLPIAGADEPQVPARRPGRCPTSTPPGCSSCWPSSGFPSRSARRSAAGCAPSAPISEWLWQGGRALFRPELRAAALARHPPARAEVPPARVLPRGPSLGMSADALADFMKSPYGLLADVKMLNFFRDLGTVGACGHPGPRRALGLREERVVPLPVPLRRAAGPGRPAEPDAHPPRARRVHRLREVREGVPFAPAGRSAALGEVRRVHRVPRVRRGLPGQGSTGSRGRPQGAGCHSPRRPPASPSSSLRSSVWPA